MTKKEKEAVMEEIRKHTFWCTIHAQDDRQPHIEPLLVAGYADIDGILERYVKDLDDGDEAGYNETVKMDVC